MEWVLIVVPWAWHWRDSCGLDTRLVLQMQNWLSEILKYSSSQIKITSFLTDIRSIWPVFTFTLIHYDFPLCLLGSSSSSSTSDLHLQLLLPLPHLKSNPLHCIYFFVPIIIRRQKEWLFQLYNHVLIVHQQVIMPSSRLRILKYPSLFAPTTCTDASRRASRKCMPSLCACGSSPAPVPA